MELQAINPATTEGKSRSQQPVAILGYGNYGNALASRLNAVGIPLVIGRRERATESTEAGLQFTNYRSAAERARIVILAVPARAYEDIIPTISESLLGKIVIDVSNAERLSDPCNAEQLAQLLPDSKVVKAFNTISAWSMQNDIYGASRNAFVCGEDESARQIVLQMAREMGFAPVEIGRLAAADALEKKVLQLFPEWRVAFWTVLFMLLFQIIYLHGRKLISKPPATLLKSIFLKYPNRITGWMVLWLLAVVFLAGCLAAFLQLKRGTKYSTFPNWLDAWMKARKQLGLFALMFAGMHACMSFILLAGEYFSNMATVEEIGQTGQKLYHRYRWNAELSLLCATLSTALLVILGLTSLPSVNKSMSWREWDFVQSKLGYLSMLFGFLHIFFYVYKSLSPERVREWKYLPHHTFLMLLFPFVVLILKLILILPGMNGMLRRIRNGWERGNDFDQSSKV